MKKNVLIISDSFMPEPVSTARHMTDLVEELTIQGYSCTVVSTIGRPVFRDEIPKIDLVTLNNPFKRSSNLILRLVFEIIYPIVLAIKFHCVVPHKRKYIFTIIWSPSIFWVLFLLCCSKSQLGSVKLIVRDLFPLWLEKLGILRRTNISFKVLSAVAKIQFSRATEIYIQSTADTVSLKKEYGLQDNKFKYLQSWYRESQNEALSSEILNMCNEPRKKILMLGTFGIAQNRDFLTDVLETFFIKNTSALLFVVGMKPHDLSALMKKLGMYELNGQIIVIDKLTHDQSVSLGKYCDLGIASLAAGNTSGNVPGKFLAYLMSGLPTFSISPKTFELSHLISSAQLGLIGDTQDHSICASQLQIGLNVNYDRDAIAAYGKKYCSVEIAVQKLTQGT